MRPFTVFALFKIHELLIRILGLILEIDECRLMWLTVPSMALIHFDVLPHLSASHHVLHRGIGFIDGLTDKVLEILEEIRRLIVTLVRGIS